MRIELLVDAGEFRARLFEDLRSARRYAWLQTFSFEGDRVGSSVARRLRDCRARDRRLLIDGYSRLVHNDRIIAGPAWLGADFRREVRHTGRWIRRLRDRGVGVRFCSPPGVRPDRLVRRNHKKLALFDERIAYLGGINFCDHNFAWHDMMIRVECASVGRLLADDFRSTWGGRPRAWDIDFGPLRIVSLNGRSNPARFAPVVRAIDEARHTIDVVSAYLSPPFSDRLAAARRRGVRVRVLTPARNNKANLARYILEAAHRARFEVIRYPHRMNHLKAMVVDDELLVAGSSNFDFMSYHVLEELVVLTRDPALLSAFRARVWEPDVADAVPHAPTPSLGTRLGHASIRVGATLAALLAIP